MSNSFKPGVDEPICYGGSLCQLPLSKRAAQLFSHTMKPVKNEKQLFINRNKQQTKVITAGLALMLRGPHEILLWAACSSPLFQTLSNTFFQGVQNFF